MDPNPSDLCVEEQKRGDRTVEATRRLRMGIEILPPDSASTVSSAFHPLPAPFEHLRLAEDPPFGTRPEVKRRRVYFTLTSPPLILEFSSTLLFILSCSLPPAFHNPLSDTASTMYRWACFPAAGHFDIFILRTWTFDWRGSAIVSRSSESLGWKYVFSFVHFVCIAELLAILARVYVLASWC